MAQCTNCQFHNMPGVAQCGRCGASLMLSVAAIDVHPPRATRWALLWRRSVPAIFWRSRIDSWARFARSINLEPEANLPGPAILLRLIVPGWAQWYSGQVLLGQCLLIAYAVCLLFAMVLLGTAMSSLLIAIAVSVHAASVYEVAYHSTVSRGGRISRFLLGCGVLGLCLYLPVNVLREQIASPIRLQINQPPMHAGDVFLVSSFWRREPRVGDIVTYDIPQGRFTGAARNVIYVARGQRIDRILAGPGQSIEWKDGHLRIDGQPSDLQPLNPGQPVVPMSFVVPSAHYLILPSAQVFGQQQQAQISIREWQYLSTVSIAEIRGQVYWQSWPLNHMGPVW